MKRYGDQLGNNYVINIHLPRKKMRKEGVSRREIERLLDNLLKLYRDVIPSRYEGALSVRAIKGKAFDNDVLGRVLRS